MQATNMGDPAAAPRKSKTASGAADLLRRIDSCLRNRCRLGRGGKILVAVSGGPDSMTLLHALHGLAGKWRWRLVVGHFNHQLRGRSSNADERLVRAAAATLRLPIAIGRADVLAFAKRGRLSIETAARKLRHEFLARTARKRNIKTIALAHHAGDQVELFFLRLLRGAGGEGLGGMKWRSPSPANLRVTLIRPLLDLGKADLLRFARETNIRFREDATNAAGDFLRNRVRNELLPLLRKRYQPGLDKVILRLMEITGAESEYAGVVAGRWLRGGGRESASGQNQRRLPPAPAVEETGFENLPAALQRRVLRQQLAARGVAADFELVESLRQSPDTFVSVGPDRAVSRRMGGGLQWRAQPARRFTRHELTVKLAGGAGEIRFENARLNWRIDRQQHLSGHPNEAASAWQRFARMPHLPIQKNGRVFAGRDRRRVEFFDADKVGDKISLRHWRPGDRFQPIGLKSVAKLQDLFTNAKIPRARRHEAIVAATACGEIFWVEGLRIGERFKLTPQTRRRLIWRR